jgi:hypothetical protein
MAPPRVSETDRGFLSGATRRRTVTAAYERGSPARDLVRAADQSGSASIAMSTNTDMPQRMEGDREPVATAFDGCRSEAGAIAGRPTPAARPKRERRPSRPLS